MPTTNSEWQGRIKGVDREHETSRFALGQIVEQVRSGRLIPAEDIRVRDLLIALDALEGTYLIRLFAEFESCLRSYWRADRTGDPPYRTRDLLDSVGAYRRIPPAQVAAAHTVRDYRNSLIHERVDSVPAIPIGRARSLLCHFVKFLPEDW